ncbi:MAG: hypothetical protein U1E76_22855 [Planctomycetota bacterium]
MQQLVRSFFAAHPDLTFRALGSRANRDALDLAPFGHTVDYLDAEDHAGWIHQYHRANQLAFPGPLALPGWVLVDCYLLPAAIGLLTGPARLLDDRSQRALELAPDAHAIGAAYYAVPCIKERVVLGCSLFSFLSGSGAAAIVKALTLRMLKARVQRGVAQWTSPSLRVHTRMGPLCLEGPPPPTHGKAAESFVYSVDLADASAWRQAMTRQPRQDPPADDPRWIATHDRRALDRLLARARAGEPIFILPPGLRSDGAAVLIEARR